MARFKAVNMSPRFLPVVVEQQIVPGAFEHALHILIDTEFDCSSLVAKFNSDTTGAPWRPKAPDGEGILAKPA
jgi:hypothetical protein